MSESQRPGSSAISKPAFFACKATPVMASLVLAAFDSPFIGSMLLLGILTGVEIFICKEYFGIGLVGLRWYFSKEEAGKFPFVVFYSRPLPYVASALDLNAFWGIMLFSAVSWSVCTILFMMWFEKKWVFMEAIFSIVNILNLFAFLKCQSTGKQESDNIAKTILLGTNESFQNVPKESDAEDSSAEESKRESDEIV